jgi:DedD protein
MEKKKLLLIAISVGIFLALTIGAAILVFAPKDVSASSMAAGKSTGAVDTGINVPAPASSNSPKPVIQNSNPQPSSVDPVELAKEVPGLQQAPNGTNRQGSEFIVGGKSTETSISVPKPSTAAVPDAAPAGRAAPAPAQATSKPAASAAPVAAVTAQKPAASAHVQAAPKPAAAASQTQTKPAPTQTQAKPASIQTKVYNDYWVQTGAFSTIDNAEGVKKTLSSKGITSIIENREVNGKTVFRVRVGPYTSQNEANYWLSLIKSINGFEDSQVRQTQSRR